MKSWWSYVGNWKDTPTQRFTYTEIRKVVWSMTDSVLFSMAAEFGSIRKDLDTIYYFF